MASQWALAKASEHLFGDNLPSGAEVHIERLACLLDEVRDECLRELANAIGVGRYVYGNEVRAYAVKLERGAVKPALGGDTSADEL